MAAHASVAPRTGVDRRAMSSLSVGHGCVDACQGAVPALLPFMIGRYDLSFAAAGALVLAATLASTMVQPLFGAFSDRISSPGLVPGGVILACTGIAVAGLVPSYPLAFVAVLASGLGVAAFHPEGSRFANYVSGARRATGMSYFSVGGNVGFAVGPILITPAVLAFGLSGTLVFLLPAAVVGGLLLVQLPHLLSFRPAKTSASDDTLRAEDSWPGLAQLVAVTACRAFAFYTLLALLPLYFIEALQTSDATANSALTAMLVAGAVGNVIGGMLADRLGRRPVLVASLVLQPPILLAATLVGVVPAIALVSLFGFIAVASFSVTIVMGQEYLPSRLGLASGLTLGAAIGFGGLAAPFFGWIGDEFGLDTSMHLLAILPAVGAILAFFLPPSASAERNLAAARAMKLGSRA